MKRCPSRAKLARRARGARFSGLCLLSAWLYGATACEATTERGAEAAEGAEPGEDDTETAPLGDEGSDMPADPLAAPPGAGESAAPAQTQAQTQATPSFDLEAWAVERGIEAKVDADRCEPAPVGDKPDQALWCWREAPPKGGFETRLIQLFVVRGQSLVKAFELPIAVSAADADLAPLVELSPRPEDDGKTVVFSEKGATCDEALARADADHPDEPNARRAKRAALETLCRRRGRYRFAGGTLRRVGPP